MVLETAGSGSLVDSHLCKVPKDGVLKIGTLISYWTPPHGGA